MPEEEKKEEFVLRLSRLEAILLTDAIETETASRGNELSYEAPEDEDGEIDPDVQDAMNTSEREIKKLRNIHQRLRMMLNKS